MILSAQMQTVGDKKVGTDPYGLLIRSVVSVVTSVKPRSITPCIFLCIDDIP